MNRYYYMSDNLDVLESVQHELEHKGVDPVRIHVLTDKDVEVSSHNVNEVESLSKKDMVRYGLRGALVGVALAIIVLLVALATGIMNTVWSVPVLFLMAVILGFCTWEGGLIGAHKPNRDIERFEDDLHRGRHVLYVDADDQERTQVDSTVATHPEVKQAGTGKAEMSSTWHVRRSLRNLIHKLP